VLKRKCSEARLDSSEAKIRRLLTMRQGRNDRDGNAGSDYGLAPVLVYSRHVVCLVCGMDSECQSSKDWKMPRMDQWRLA